MNSIHLDYPINHLEEIPESSISEAVSKVYPTKSGYRIQGSEAILIPEAWLTYLFSTNHEDRSYDLLHKVIVNGEDPEQVFQFVLKYLGTLGFRRVRSIADGIRFLLDTSKVITDRTKWEPFLSKLDAEADKEERLYRKISHIDWVVPGPDYTLMLWCRDQKLRFLDVSPLMDQAPFHRIKDPKEFRKVTAFYGAVTWFAEDVGNEIDIDSDWCYANGIVVDPFEIGQAIQKNSPIRSLDLSTLEKPKLTAEQWSRSDGSDSLDSRFLDLWLPDCADENFPVERKNYYGNETDMKNYMDAVRSGPWAVLHEHRLTAYQQYCDGNRRAKTHWGSHMIPLFTSHKVAYRQQLSFENVHWTHVDRANRMIPLRARKITLDQVLLEIGEEYLYCIRPYIEGLEQADFRASKWVPITKTVFSAADVIDFQNGNYRARLYMEAGIFDSFPLALTTMETPGQVDLTAVMNEFFGEFA